MSNKQYYGGLIWTNHALSKLSQRGLTQESAWKTFKYPDSLIKGKKPETIQHQKNFGSSVITVIVKQNEKKEWIVLSCWIDPPSPDSIDAKKREEYQKYRKASFWGKIFLTFRRQIGF